MNIGRMKYESSWNCGGSHLARSCPKGNSKGQKKGEGKGKSKGKSSGPMFWCLAGLAAVTTFQKNAQRWREGWRQKQWEGGALASTAAGSGTRRRNVRHQSERSSTRRRREGPAT